MEGFKRAVFGGRESTSALLRYLTYLFSYWYSAADRPQVEALLLSLNVPCSGNAFQGKDAWKQLLDFVEAYFQSSLQNPEKGGVHLTKSCPIFLQRPKHSLTVVGLERTRSGTRRLLVFDPAWQPPSKLKTPLETTHLSSWAFKALLRRYRKSQRYLKRFNAFETLTVQIA